MPSPFAELWPDTRDLFLAFCNELRRTRLPLLISLLLILALALLLWPHDRSNLQTIQSWAGPESRPLAEAISFYGDFYTGTLALVLLIWLGGVAARRRSWRRAALAILLSSAIAGLSVNCFRLTLGRPRPSTGVPDGFYGLHPSAGYHGFPSGHAATSFGTAGPILFLNPPLGLPAFAAASAVGWSRMQLDRHFPTDILVGAWFGLAAGFLAARAARSLPPPDNPAGSS